MKLIESFFLRLRYARFFFEMAFEKVNTFIVSNLFKLDTINESETNSITEIFDSNNREVYWMIFVIIMATIDEYSFILIWNECDFFRRAEIRNFKPKWNVSNRTNGSNHSEVEFQVPKKNELLY